MSFALYPNVNVLGRNHSVAKCNVLGPIIATAKLLVYQSRLRSDHNICNCILAAKLTEMASNLVPLALLAQAIRLL